MIEIEASTSVASEGRMQKISRARATGEAMLRGTLGHQPKPVIVPLGLNAAVVASDQRFAYYGTSALAVRLLRLDQKIVSSVPMSLRRVADVLDTDVTLFQEFCDRFSKYGDWTLTLFADGRAVEAPVFRGPHPLSREWRTSTNCSSRLSSDAIASNLIRSFSPVAEAAKRLARSIWLRRLSASVMTAALWFGSLSERSLTTLWLMICQYSSVAALVKTEQERFRLSRFGQNRVGPHIPARKPQT
jgi:hypothetical protein